MKRAGFEAQELVGTTNFKSSPVTTGALFLARKGLEKNAIASVHERESIEIPEPSGKGTPTEQSDGST